MSQAKLIEALKQLDAKNDGHWTGDGLPRLDVVKTLSGIDVSRSDIANVAKGFSRKNPVVVAPDTGTASAPVAPWQSAKPAVTPAEAEAQIKEEREERDSELKFATIERDKLEAEVVALNKQINELKAQAFEKTEALDAVIMRIEGLNGKRTLAEDIQAFIKSQAKQRAERAKR